MHNMLLLCAMLERERERSACMLAQHACVHMSKMFLLFVYDCECVRMCVLCLGVCFVYVYIFMCLCILGEDGEREGKLPVHNICVLS